MASTSKIVQYLIAAAVIIGAGFLVSGVFFGQPTPIRQLNQARTKQVLTAPSGGFGEFAAKGAVQSAPAGAPAAAPAAPPTPMSAPGTTAGTGLAPTPGQYYREATNVPAGGKIEGVDLPEVGAAYHLPNPEKPILNDQSIDNQVQLFRPKDNGALFARQIGLDTSNEFRMQDSYDVAPGVTASLEGFDAVGLPQPLSIVDVENQTLNELTVQSLKRNINKDIRGGIQVPMSSGCDDTQRGGFSHGISTIGRMAEAPVRARTRQEYQALNQYGINSVLAV